MLAVLSQGQQEVKLQHQQLLCRRCHVLPSGLGSSASLSGKQQLQAVTSGEPE